LKLFTKKSKTKKDSLTFETPWAYSPPQAGYLINQNLGRKTMKNDEVETLKIQIEMLENQVRTLRDKTEADENNLIKLISQALATIETHDEGIILEYWQARRDALKEIYGHNVQSYKGD